MYNKNKKVNNKTISNKTYNGIIWYKMNYIRKKQR